MKQLKSSLNPHAAPFFPSYQKAFPTDFCQNNKFDKVESVGSVDLESTDIHHKIKSLESDVLNLDLKSSGEVPSGDGNIAIDISALSASEGITETGKQDLVEEFDAVTEVLAAEFPNVSLESLAEIFFINNGDLDETLNMLEQLEGPVSDPDAPGSSNARYGEAEHVKVGEPSGLADSK